MALESLLPTGIFAAFAGMMFLVVILGIGLYIYLSFAVMTIGRREKVDYPALAWIPGLGPGLVFRKIAKMHWWPFLLLIGALIPFINIFATIAFMVFFFMWWWKTTEARKFPGWTVLLALIPIVGSLWMYVQLGLLAWKKE
ncbi:hypothetical protein K9M74_00150 [Candidatus Woesearchaeota archaeon]|nr:hypothetical protein [Candidatus Woesearchaeota archaeon]